MVDTFFDYEEAYYSFKFESKKKLNKFSNKGSIKREKNFDKKNRTNHTARWQKPVSVRG